MIIRILFLLVLVAPTLCGDVVFRNVRVFDGEKVLPAGTEVLVSDGKIAAVGRRLKVAEGTEVIDAARKTLMPGLIDAHTHAFGNALTEALMFGVTTELDQFTAAEAVRSWKAAQDAGNVTSRADIFSAGTLVTAPKGHGTEYGMDIPTITSPSEALAFVDARIAEGSDWIKIVYDDGSAYGMSTPTIDLATLRAVIAAAHQREKLAVVHVGERAAARQAIEAGADGLVHLFVDEAPDGDLGSFVAKHEAFVIPTLSVLRSVSGTSPGKALLEDARLRPYISADARRELPSAFPRSAKRPPVTFEGAQKSVELLLKAGVPILAGTDAPNPGTGHGVSMHGELALLVEAGLTPEQALRAGTSAPAKAFGIKDRGRIAKGLRADLLLIDGDPTKEITATREIAGIWKGGAAINRSAYAKSVEESLTQALASPAGLDAPILSDFENGTLASSFGTGWQPTADDIAGGKSTGTIAVTDGGAVDTAKSLLIRGTIDGAIPYAWYGAMWSPGAGPMQAKNLSAKKGLHFRAKGDGKTYRVMIFAASKGQMPLVQRFVAGPEWTEVSMPWSAFGIDGSDVMAVIFAGGPQAGEFAMQVDQVRLE
jgi:imidazolonepropionase-like amidohydrolase